MMKKELLVIDLIVLGFAIILAAASVLAYIKLN